MNIYALSSGPGISGVAVIRISGKKTKSVIKQITSKELPKPRLASFIKIVEIFFVQSPCLPWAKISMLLR